VVEMLPYNWQWAGICELYRNIRCNCCSSHRSSPCFVLQVPLISCVKLVKSSHRADVHFLLLQPISGRHPPRRLACQQHAVGGIRLTE
jgi:hypothetical protein